MNEEEKQKFRKQHMLDLRGKEYLPVAARVFIARTEHPEWQFHTEFRKLDDDGYMFAKVLDGQHNVLATAFKRIRSDGKGPAGQYPVETAETGAMGRALALCGYGTMSGDIDEGDQISDAPIGKNEKKWR